MLSKKSKTINVSELQGFEFLIYGIMKKHEIEGVKSTIDNVHFEAVEYILKFRPSFEGNTTTIQALDKLAIPNKTTGEWKLKPQESIRR